MGKEIVSNIFPPYLLVKQTGSIYAVSIPISATNYAYGYIEQINFNTISVAEGDRVLFSIEPGNPMIIAGSDVYYILEEAKIFFIE
jgi:co-chaperonin GroES (HSP10)